MSERKEPGLNHDVDPNRVAGWFRQGVFTTVSVVTFVICVVLAIVAMMVLQNRWTFFWWFVLAGVWLVVVLFEGFNTTKRHDNKGMVFRDSASQTTALQHSLQRQDYFSDINRSERSWLWLLKTWLFGDPEVTRVGRPRGADNPRAQREPAARLKKPEAAPHAHPPRSSEPASSPGSVWEQLFGSDEVRRTGRPSS
jgi:hypothetical protein